MEPFRATLHAIIMSKNQKKKEREAAIQAEVAKRENARLEKSPLNKEQMTSLFIFVGSNIVENGLKEEFEFTNHWLNEHAHEAKSVLEFFRSQKIMNDWDLLVNGDPFAMFGKSSSNYVWMPLEKNELQDLLRYLDSKLEKQSCQHNMALTDSWLEKTDYKPSEVKAALFAQGGFCDCEVMFNVETSGIYV